MSHQDDDAVPTQRGFVECGLTDQDLAERMQKQTWAGKSFALSAHLPDKARDYQQSHADDRFPVYRAVYCLILYWEESNLKDDLDPEIELLHQCLRVTYNFSVITMPIPSTEPEAKVTQTLKDFYNAIHRVPISQDQRPQLVMWLYTGHGGRVPPDNWNQEYRITGKHRLDWKKLESAFTDEACLDHLIFMDSCYSANAVPYSAFTDADPTVWSMYQDLGKAVNNILPGVYLDMITAASHGWKAWTGKDSLTRRLIKAMNRFAVNQQAFTIRELCQVMGQGIDGGITTTTQPVSDGAKQPYGGTRWLHFPVSKLSKQGEEKKLARLPKSLPPMDSRNPMGRLQAQSDSLIIG